MADWSKIPCDVLGEIALKLDQRDDFIRFSAVCHSWNHASSLVKSLQNPKNPEVPWLLLAENTNENPDCIRKVYDLSNDKCYRLKVPETFGVRCWGSSYGWIAMQTYDYQVHLFNPFTKVHITNLPSVLTMAHQPNDDPPEPDDDLEPIDPSEEQRWYFKYFVNRVVVLKMPHNQPLDDGGDLLIAAIFGECDYLAFARLGDKSWTYIVSGANDVACLEDRIYIVCCDGQLLYFDIKGCDGDLVDIKVMEYAPSCRSEILDFDKVYLLDLCGDLVMAVRSKRSVSGGSYVTIGFDVYKLDNKIKEWVQIDDIGKFTIFVGHHSSVASPASMAHNCKSNCIYFTDDEYGDWHRVPGFGGFDMGIYYICSRLRKGGFYFGDDMNSPICPPIFFLPKF